MMRQGEFIETTEHFPFPDLSASATLVRIKSESSRRRLDEQVVGRTRRGLPVYGSPVEVEYAFDANALIMRKPLGLLESIKQGHDVVEDVTHLPEIPEDDAARLAIVRGQLEAFLA